MKSVFLSDAHLTDSAAPNYRRILEFLDRLPPDLGQLVINGDFFDAWFGENRVAERMYGPVLERLDAFAARGMEVVFVEGNHDFRLQSVLSRRGYRVVEGIWLTVLGSKRVHVEHGDQITGDGWYRLLRASLRSRAVAGLNAVVPDAWSMRIGLAMSTASRRRAREYEAAVNAKLVAYASKLTNVDVFITGHTHFPLDCEVKGPNGAVRVINLGDWVENFTYLWIEDDNWELRRA